MLPVSRVISMKLNIQFMFLVPAFSGSLNIMEA